MFLHGRTMFAPTMRVVGELTHTRSVCVGVAETGGINTYAKQTRSATPRQGQKVAGTG